MGEMTVNDLLKYYENKQEHYEISDYFVMRDNGKYQQSRKSGYMAYARKVGVFVDSDKAEANQKWHLLESYCAQKDPNFKIRRNTFKCPELILWMAEAAGIDKESILAAEEEARKIIDEGTNGWARNRAGGRIIEMIGWERFESEIMKKTR